MPYRTVASGSAAVAVAFVIRWLKNVQVQLHVEICVK